MNLENSNSLIGIIMGAAMVANIWAVPSWELMQIDMTKRSV